jgi:LAO/AO transport system kinase
MTDLAEGVLAGDVRAVARAATLIENGSGEAEALLQKLFPSTGRALLLGVTGPPGAGKSTLCAELTREFRKQGKTVAILAVDPTSPYTGGAILGDRIRMLQHYADPGVFIRSMATRGWLGGLARATTELTLLLDAAGYNIVMIETVGVGQDEVEIARLADVTAVVLVPGMGDDVQSIKAGIMEIADVFVINKADQPGADKLKREIEAQQPRAPILFTVATRNEGIPELSAAIEAAGSRRADPDRSAQLWTGRLRQMLRDRMLDRVPASEFVEAAREIAAHRRDPYSFLHDWLERY